MAPRTAVILRAQGTPDDLYITLSGPNFPLAISPDGRLIVCADVSGASNVVLRYLSDDSTRPLHAWGAQSILPDSRWIGFSASSLMARYVRTGHIVYAEGRALFAVAVDDQFHPLGEAIPLIQGIQNNEGSYASVAVSDNGTVVYLPSERVRGAELVWMDREPRSDSR